MDLEHGLVGSDPLIKCVVVSVSVVARVERLLAVASIVVLGGVVSLGSIGFVEATVSKLTAHVGIILINDEVDNAGFSSRLHLGIEGVQGLRELCIHRVRADSIDKHVNGAEASLLSTSENRVLHGSLNVLVLRNGVDEVVAAVAREFHVAYRSVLLGDVIEDVRHHVEVHTTSSEANDNRRISRAEEVGYNSHARLLKVAAPVKRIPEGRDASNGRLGTRRSRAADGSTDSELNDSDAGGSLDGSEEGEGNNELHGVDSCCGQIVRSSATARRASLAVALAKANDFARSARSDASSYPRSSMVSLRSVRRLPTDA